MSEAARELVIFIDNDGDLYRQQGAPIRENLSKKYRKGIYDHAQAVKLWKYLADTGAKKYAQEFASPSEWNRMFTVADRKAAAQEMADMWRDEMELGNFMEPKKRAANPAPRIGTARPRRVSQLTKKPPTKRLVARRKKNTDQGYFPNPDIGRKHNPIADKIALHFNAGNDANGTPRRVFVVVNTSGVVIKAIDEGYLGERAVTGEFPGIAIVGQFPIKPVDYKHFLRTYK